MPQKPYRIAHLSDLHLTARDDASRSEPRIFGKLKGMNAAFRSLVRTPDLASCDLILVTGDVTDCGESGAWKVFWDALRSRGLADRLVVLPGNHDLCCLGLRPLRPDKDYAKADLEKAAEGLKMGGQRTKFPWVAVPDPRVAVFCLNSCNLGNLTAMTNAIGQLGYYQLLTFADQLHKYRDVPVKIVALHHSPNIPKAETARKCGQAGVSVLTRLTMQIPAPQRRALRLLCVTHRVRMIVHGHMHLKEDREVNSVRIVGAPATTEPAKSRGRQYHFWIYTVTASNRVLHQLRTVTL